MVEKITPLQAGLPCGSNNIAHFNKLNGQHLSQQQLTATEEGPFFAMLMLSNSITFYLLISAWSLVFYEAAGSCVSLSVCCQHASAFFSEQSNFFFLSIAQVHLCMHMQAYVFTCQCRGENRALAKPSYGLMISACCNCSLRFAEHKN